MTPLPNAASPVLTAIAEDVRAFIAADLLLGQDDDLTTTTPLLELGILDSFSLLKLAGHLNARYGLDLPPAEIAGDDFRSIEAIARMVVRRRGADMPADVAASPPLPDGVVVFDAPACAQVFILFAGLGIGLANTPEFFTAAGLEGRNLVVLRDAQAFSYQRGISAELPTPDAVCDWLRRWIDQRPQIDEIYCIGVSSGGPMAMIAGRRLGARMVWTFGPRTVGGDPSKTLTSRFGAFLQEATGKTLGRLLLDGLTPEDHRRIESHITPEIIEDYHRGLLDPVRILDFAYLRELVDELASGDLGIEQRVYYVPLDECDAWVANALRACPGVTLIAIEPATIACPTWAFTPWVPQIDWLLRHHLVVNVLRDRGKLAELFPPFRAGAPAQARAATAPQGAETPA